MTARELAPGVVEGQTLTSDLEAVADVCIVGSGAGGAVAAATLQAAGLKVLVVEEGGYFTSSRFRMREADAYPNLYQESAQRTTKDLSVAIFQGRTVGGGTVVNWTTCFRTPDHVVEHWRAKHAVGSISPADLAPHFDAVEERLSVAPIPLEATNRNNRTLYEGCKALGYEAEPIKRNVRGCALTGYCGMGCPIDAKQSMLVTYLPDAMNRGATVLSRCRVERLVLEGNEVTGLEGTLLDADGVKPTGVKARVKAKRFLLAAGAIGTPSVLLRSAVPDPHGLVGARTFLHPVVAVVGEFEEPVNGYYGAPQSIASHAFAQRGDDVGFFLEAAPIHPLLASITMPGFGRGHRAFMERLPHFAAHIAITIDGFHDDVPGGRVKLRPSGAPLLDYELAPRTLAAFREGQRTLARVQLAAGARRALTTHTPPVEIRSESDLKKLDDAPYGPGLVPAYSAHQMGGAGISDDPARGVVRSEDLRHHQLTNLHVVDGSVFPTSLGVNPQESIYGLSHLISTRLAAAWT